MANQCVNGTLEGANYSSPVPVIGLYIAAGTIVCLLFMLFDISSAIRHRQVWVPCRLLSLNSLTLTLLGICTKLPVDLTTAMPGAHDQLSKLTATTLLCVAIGFMSPSLQSRTPSESLSNIIALSILVITVVVNMCIQISTGVVLVLIVEHIIVLVCMLVLLLFLWHFALQTVDGVRDPYNSMDSSRKFFAKTFEGSMSRLLEVFHLLGYGLNPQMVVVKDPNNFAMSVFCFLPSAALIQATVRSVFLKQQFNICGGTSDYSWSMPMIVTIQVIMVIVGCFALTVRCARMFSQVAFSLDFWPVYNRFSVLLGMGGSFRFKCGVYLGYYASSTILYGVSVARIISIFPAIVYFQYFGRFSHHWEYADPLVSTSLCYDGVMLGEKLVLNATGKAKALSDIQRWVEKNRSSPLTNLSQFLQRTAKDFEKRWVEKNRSSPSQQLTAEGQIYPKDFGGVKVYALSLAVLVRIATVALPSDPRTKSLLETFNEVYEVVDFVEAVMGSPDSPEWRRDYRKLAKALALWDDFKVEISSSGKPLQILENIQYTMPHLVLSDQVAGFIQLIKRRGLETEGEIYSFIEQFCVDILHSILACLPVAIHKEATECPAEEFEERVTHCFRMLSKVESIDKIKWIFPEGKKISSLTSNLTVSTSPV